MSTHKADLKGAVWQWAERIGVEGREVHLRSIFPLHSLSPF